jgi:hypothetical protein
VVKKLFFHLFDLALVNVHILHQIRGKENFRLYKFMGAVAEGLVSDTGMEIKEQHRSSARRLTAGDHYAYRIP